MVEKKKQKPKTQALQIYVGEEMMTVAQTVQAQIGLLAMQTPEKYIMKREGRGGLILEYVKTNYVIGRLNATFFFNWDSEIVEQIIDREHNQIAMKVRLTVRFANGNEVKKDAWGGSDIKWTKGQTKKMIDFADDLKSAESDGIKKAASMLGICWDVYSGLKMNGKKKAAKKDFTDDGFTNMGGSPDVASEFRVIPVMINKKKVMHTKYEALDRFKKAKEQLGKELYYKILGQNGYEKSNQITNKDIPKLYEAMAEAYKQEKKIEKIKVKTKDSKVTSGVAIEAIEKVFQSTSFSTNILDTPTQSEIMELTRLEATLVDKYEFTPDQILEDLTKVVNENNISKMTKSQVREGIKYFTGIIEQLEKDKQNK